MMEKCSSRTDTHTHTPRLHACAGQECRTRTGTQAKHATDGIRPGRTHCEASTVSTRGIRPGRTLLQVALQHSHWASDMRTGPSRSGRYGSWWPSTTRIRPGRMPPRVALQHSLWALPQRVAQYRGCPSRTDALASGPLA